LKIKKKVKRMKTKKKKKMSIQHRNGVSHQWIVRAQVVKSQMRLTKEEVDLMNKIKMRFKLKILGWN